MAKKKTIRTIPQERTPIAVQDPGERAKNFSEVALGYGLDETLNECERCLMCPEAACVAGCPVGIDIPGFIAKTIEKDYQGAIDKINSLLTQVCDDYTPIKTLKDLFTGLLKIKPFDGFEGWEEYIATAISL